MTKTTSPCSNLGRPVRYAFPECPPLALLHQRRTLPTENISRSLLPPRYSPLRNDSFHDVNQNFRPLTCNANLGVEVRAFRKYCIPEAVSRLKRCGARRRIFCATFRTKLCNTRFKRQDLHWGVVDSKMFLFYCSQIGQCSIHTYDIVTCTW